VPTLTSICDVFDGRIARATRTSSPYGGFLTARSTASWSRSRSSGSPCTCATSRWARRWLPRLAGLLLVSYARARGESLGVVQGRADAARRAPGADDPGLLLDAAVVGATHQQRGRLVFWAMMLIAVGTFVTAVHRTAWISMRLRAAARPPE
jgi:phosphatidylglycerophosphate synthase